jgi:THO complex subunit 2
MEVEDGEVDDAKLATPRTIGTEKQTLARNEPLEVNSIPPASVVIMESKKSEILDRREQIKRENAAKAAALSPPGIPRPESNRGSMLDRNSPSLPNRPDAPFPSRDLIDRHQQPRHSERRDGWDPRLPDPRGIDRAVPRPGDRGRDFSGNDRRGMDPGPRDFGRPNDRSLGVDRERVRPEPPPRWIGDPNRDHSDRPNNGPRGIDSGRLGREPLPRPLPGVPMDRGPPGNPDRMSFGNTETINPERAALISGENDLTRSESPRRGRDDLRDRGVPRQLSPRRNDNEFQDTRRDDRRNGPSDAYNISRGRSDDNQPPPAGPRGDRATDRDRNGGPDRSSFQPSQAGPRLMDPDHGRLNFGARPQPDPNFGRLNQNSPPEIPLGPRDRNSRGTRPANSSMPGRHEGKPDLPRPPTPDKQPPTGPSGRHPRRSASGQFDQNSSASPAPGIHPDRLAQLGSSVPQTPQQASPLAQVSTPSMHPDRMKAFDNDTSTPLSTPSGQMNRPRQQLPLVNTSGAPLGPKGVQSSPVAQSVNGFAAPTGPASAQERAARGGRRQLAGINTMLQQAGQQLATPDRMTSRGRGRISSGIGPETPISGPSTPVVPPPPPPGLPPVRHEQVRDSSRDLLNPERADLITGGTPQSDERERDRNGRRERSGRSRRSSRSPGRERESKHAGSEDRTPRNEYQHRSDRRTGDSERDRHRGASPGKDLVAGREGGREREHRDRESSRRDGREREATREAVEAGWNGERSGERGGERSERGGRSREMREARGDDRRDSRGNREDGGSGRKRRGEEGGLDSRGHEKRPRR